MATRNEIRGARTSAIEVLARIFFILVGLGAIGWGGFFLPIFWRQSPTHHVAMAYMQGRGFSGQVLLKEAQQVTAVIDSPFCDPTALHDAVMLRLAILDNAIAAANQTLVASGRDALYDTTRKALSCAPADAFAWLTLFWLDASRKGVTPDDANYLRLSYTGGPNEAWIGLWRNRLAIALFAQLPPDLSDDAIDEFIKLLDTGRLYQQTVAIFASAVPAAQNRIVDHLETANATARGIFVRELYDRGLDMKIPDVEIPGLRPWER